MRTSKKVKIDPMMSVLSPSGSSKGSSLTTSDYKAEIKYIVINDIISYKKQARVFFDEDSLNELADSIRSQGIIQPLQIIPSREISGKYEVVSGERRLKAAKMLGMDKVPCMVLDSKKDSELVAVIENVQRKDLNPLELSKALFDLTKNSKHGEKAAIANKLGVSPAFMSQHLSVYSLPEDVKDYLLSQKGVSLKYLLRLKKMDNEDEIREEVFKKKVIGVSRSVLKVTYDGNDFNVSVLNKNLLDKEALIKLKDSINDHLDNLAR